MSNNDATASRRPRRRARSRAAKTARRNALLGAANKVLEKKNYDDMTLADVAQAADLSKASTYTYYVCKESLFLDVLKQKLQAWQSAFAAQISQGPASPQTIASAFAETLTDDAILLDLLTRLHSTLEKNVPAKEILAFKRFSLGLMAATGRSVAAANPALSEKDIKTFLLLMHALVVGLGMMCNPPPTVARVIASDELLASAFQLDLKTELTAALETLLLGRAAQDRATAKTG